MIDQRTAIAIALVALTSVACRQDPNNFALNQKVAHGNFSLMIPAQWDARDIPKDSPTKDEPGMLDIDNYRWADSRRPNGGRESFNVRDMGAISISEAVRQFHGKTTVQVNLEKVRLPSGIEAETSTHQMFGHVLGPFRDYYIPAGNGHVYLALGVGDTPESRHQAERIFATLTITDAKTVGTGTPN
ncbi:MAG: hypothetical protein HY077_01385 [Elusimicrobia bacterium]|nr:hypothetical protein [Elusimicrobiota bacterium]